MRQSRGGLAPGVRRPAPPCGSERAESGEGGWDSEGGIKGPVGGYVRRRRGVRMREKLGPRKEACEAEEGRGAVPDMLSPGTGTGAQAVRASRARMTRD